MRTYLIIIFNNNNFQKDLCRLFPNINLKKRKKYEKYKNKIEKFLHTIYEEQQQQQQKFYGCNTKLHVIKNAFTKKLSNNKQSRLYYDDYDFMTEIVYLYTQNHYSSMNVMQNFEKTQAKVIKLHCCLFICLAHLLICLDRAERINAIDMDWIELQQCLQNIYILLFIVNKLLFFKCSLSLHNR